MNASVTKAKENGWGVGTVLVGTDYHETSKIRITYMSDQTLLAINLKTGRENNWTLLARKWEEWSE